MQNIQAFTDTKLVALAREQRTYYMTSFGQLAYNLFRKKLKPKYTIGRLRQIKRIYVIESWNNICIVGRAFNRHDNGF